MQSVVAMLITDTQVEVAASSDGGEPIARNFDNSESGVEALLTWLREAMSGESEPLWVATVPIGDGGTVYSWLHESVPELFLQNPSALKHFASKAGLPWDTAQTLLAFQKDKKW